MKETWNRVVTVKGKNYLFKSDVWVVDSSYFEVKADCGENYASNYIKPGVYNQKTVENTFVQNLRNLFDQEGIEDYPKTLLADDDIEIIIEMVE